MEKEGENEPAKAKCPKCGEATRGWRIVTTEEGTSYFCVNCEEQEAIKAITGINQCYDEIISFLNEWIDIPLDYKKLIAIWVIGTYFHKSFSSYPYLFFNAQKGSGKTRVEEIISWLWRNGNGTILNNPSEPVLFRTAQQRGLMIDEFENEKSKEKQMMRQILNSCYKQGGTVIRMEDEKIDGKVKKVPREFPLYTPVCIANINGLDDVLQDRAITMILEKSGNPYIIKKIQDFGRNPKIKEIKANLSQFCVGLCSVYPPEKWVDDWNLYIEARYSSETIHPIHTLQSIHNYTQLYTRLDIEEALLKLDNTEIVGRNLELFFPLLILARLMNREVFEDILRICDKLNKAKKEADFAESRDIILIEFIASCDPYRFEMVKSRKLLEEFKTFLGEPVTEETLRADETWWGIALRRLNLVAKKKRTNSGMLLLLNVDHAKHKLQMFKIEEDA